MAAGSDTRRGYAAEDIVAELFSRLGYAVHKNVLVAGIEVDLVVHKNGLRSPVEVKARPLVLSELTLQAVKLRSLQDVEGFGMPIIVVVGKISPAAKDWAQQQFNLQVWDLDVLHTKARPYEKLYQKLQEFESEHRITRAEPSQDLEKRDEVTRLIGKLQDHEDNGGLTAHEYERLCLEVFAFFVRS